MQYKTIPDERVGYALCQGLTVISRLIQPNLKICLMMPYLGFGDILHWFSYTDLVFINRLVTYRL